jgi:hypothetical protein
MARLSSERVETIDEAERERFLGSLTVRGRRPGHRPGAEERDDFWMKCRLYKTPEGLGPLPPDTWIREALSRASG